jgi:hypothetical protein
MTPDDLAELIEDAAATAAYQCTRNGERNGTVQALKAIAPAPEVDLDHLT